MPLDKERNVLVIGSGPVARLVVYDFALRNRADHGCVTAYWWVRNKGEREKLAAFGINAKSATDLGSKSDAIDVSSIPAIKLAPEDSMSEAIGGLGCGQLDAVIACVKAFSLPDLLMEVQSAGINCPVLAIANGFHETEKHFLGILYGGAKILNNELVYSPQQKLLWGVPARGANHDAPGALIEFFNGDGLIEAAYSGDVHRQMVEKLLVNAVINPITALAHAPNKYVFSTSAGPLVAALASECISILKIAYPDYGITVGKAMYELAEMAHVTGENISSMLEDVRKVHQTEIMQINGAIADLADMCGIPAPLNKLLCRIIPLLADAVSETGGAE